MRLHWHFKIMDGKDLIRRIKGSMNRDLLVWIAAVCFFLVVVLWDEVPKRHHVKISPKPVQAIHINHILNLQNKTSVSSQTVENIKSVSGSGGIDTWFEKYKTKTGRRPNVLFLVADDMRPDIKAYAHPQSPWLEPQMVTPNLDQLAKQSLVLRRAYCQQSWCNPSRSSFLTSRRPDTTMVHNNTVFFRQINPNFKTLPQYFLEQGYFTIGMGKIFHLMGVVGDHDDEYSWSVPMLRSEDCLDEGDRAWRAIKSEDRRGKLLQDELVTKLALESLEKITPMVLSGKQPFFVAVGIKKPHLSFVHPAEFLEHYPLENISMPANPRAPKDMPGCAWFHSNEIRGRKEYRKETDVWEKDKPLAEWVVKELRRAYWATITYVDNLIGQIITKLEEMGLAEDTIISFIGDHGYHLGEHSIIGKNTNFEVANNSPMMIRVPGVTDIGLVSDKLVEFVDLFPTLADLAGLPPVPQCPGGVQESSAVNLCTEGSSLLPLFTDPSTTNWKDRVFFQYPHFTGAADVWCMGYSIRTEQFRYTEWIDYHYQTGANWTQLCGVELYDHITDPHETMNRAEDPGVSEIRAELSYKLKAGWAEAIPS